MDRRTLHMAYFFLPPLSSFLDAESIFFAAQSHKSQFNLCFSSISAGKSLGQDCRSS